MPLIKSNHYKLYVVTSCSIIKFWQYTEIIILYIQRNFLMEQNHG